MNNFPSSRFILHVSDFHLSDNPEDIERAHSVLRALTTEIDRLGIKIDYLIHTGDVINSGDLYNKTALECGFLKKYNCNESVEEKPPVFNTKKFIQKSNKKEVQKFNDQLRENTNNRFKAAAEIMTRFVADLNITFGNVAICCGNHDSLCPIKASDSQVLCTKTNKNCGSSCCAEDNFELFYSFLDMLGAANSKKRSGTSFPNFCSIGNLNILVLNTNWNNPIDMKPGYHCVNCREVRNTINSLIWNGHNALNVVIAHKPVYEFCETARLSYKRYIKTPFMADLQRFIGDHGIYLCGDKHTRSIADSLFHDIPHYICGEPLTVQDPPQGNHDIEYNLLEVIDNRIGMERKIHLCSSDGQNWSCYLRPQDAVIAKLYKCSVEYIIHNAFEMISSTKSFSSWESLCQETYRWSNNYERTWAQNVSNLYRAISKFRQNGIRDIMWRPGQDVFTFMCNRISDRIGEDHSKNILNIRGEYSSGKSTFLGLFYLYLLQQFSAGKISFIPAYFNLESKEMLDGAKHGRLYFDSAQAAFKKFAKDIYCIAEKEHLPICFIIDGLDEQDCWSHYSEDSVGRGLLDILANYNNAWYVMCYSQHRLPYFKNTMPVRKYNDNSDILYINPLDVREDDAEDTRFTSFVDAFIQLKQSTLPTYFEEAQYKNYALSYAPECSEHLHSDNSCSVDIESTQRTLRKDILKDECRIIGKFRRLTISPGFMHHHFDFITATTSLKEERGKDKTIPIGQATQTKQNHLAINSVANQQKLLNSNMSTDAIYKYYIDKQHEICVEKLGYGFITYAPPMAYLFSFCGYTYERFMHLHEDVTFRENHNLQPIWENQDKVYNSFLLIKKQKDVREYLLGLHYNRELRYYAEHLDEPIESNSILNEFITRNVAVIIRKLWTDVNKFLIVCQRLLGRDDLSNCAQSMLIYCLAHMQIYKPIRDRLQAQMRKKAESTLKKQHPYAQTLDKIKWEISSKSNPEQLRQFIDLSLLHTLTIFDFSDQDNTHTLTKMMQNNSAFCTYNRQYQMLYYGDLCIHGEDRMRSLDPNSDFVGKGFDFHNCFNYLYVKLKSNENYPLREFDMYTMYNLLHSRLEQKYLATHVRFVTAENTFFYRKEYEEKSLAILVQAKGIFDEYISNVQNSSITRTAYKWVELARDYIHEEIRKRKGDM